MQLNRVCTAEMSQAEKLTRVNEIIELLQLTKCQVRCASVVIQQSELVLAQDSRIGNSLNKGISGGERRRVSLGIEMITNVCTSLWVCTRFLDVAALNAVPG